LSEQLARADHNLKVAGLVAHDVRTARTRLKHSAKVPKMLVHPAEVEKGDTMVKSFEARGLAEFLPALLDPRRHIHDVGNIHDGEVVVIPDEHVPSVGPEE
jgi:hypothetical protein